MRTINTWKATGDDQEGLVVRFQITVPDVYPIERERPHLLAAAAYTAEAKKIVDAMSKALPGGLFDAIFGQMCLRAASIFAVPHDQEKP